MMRAVDKLLQAATETDKEQARKWVNAWRAAGGECKPRLAAIERFYAL